MRQPRREFNSNGRRPAPAGPAPVGRAFGRPMPFGAPVATAQPPVTAPPPRNQPAPPPAEPPVDRTAPHKQGRDEKVGVSEIEAVLERNKARIQELIPPGLTLTADRLITTALTAVSNSRALAQCRPSSVLFSTMAAARLGLSFVAEQGYLIPREAKGEGGTHLYNYATFVGGYQGLITVAARAGIECSAQAVMANDAFESGTRGGAYYVDWTPARQDRGDIAGAFAIFRRQGEDRILHFEWMTMDQIRDSVQAARLPMAGNGVRVDSPWQTANRDQMVRKTPLRRGFKYLPKSNESMALAVELENRADEETPIDDLFDNPQTEGT